MSTKNTKAKAPQPPIGTNASSETAGGSGGGSGPCSVCRVPSSQLCSGCGALYYCGRPHQQQHWPAHKPTCKLLRSLDTCLADVTQRLGASCTEKGDLVTQPPSRERTECQEGLVVTDTVHKGRVVLAGKPFKRGDVCLSEAPIALFTDTSSTSFKDLERVFERKGVSRAHFQAVQAVVAETKNDPTGLVRLLFHALEFELLSNDQQERTLALHSPPLDQPGFAQTLDRAVDALYAKHPSILPFDSNTCKRMALVLKANSYSCGVEGKYVALNSLGCRISHSCEPNSFKTHTEDGRMVVRPVQDIPVGEEITVTYLSPEQLLLPRDERRKVLQEVFCFECVCNRCVREHDDVRGYACPECKKGTVLAPVGTEGGSFGPCSACSHTPPTTWVTGTTATEHLLCKRLQSLQQAPTTTIGPSLMQLIRECGLVGMAPNHYVMYQAFDLQADWFGDVAGGPLAALVPLHSMLDGLALSMPFYPFPLAFVCKRIGDALHDHVRHVIGCAGKHVHTAESAGKLKMSPRLSTLLRAARKFLGISRALFLLCCYDEDNFFVNVMRKKIEMLDKFILD